MIDEHTKKLFLNEYKTLCLKYNLHIDACGCCSSPWLNDVTNVREIISHIEHLEDCKW